MTRGLKFFFLLPKMCKSGKGTYIKNCYFVNLIILRNKSNIMLRMNKYIKWITTEPLYLINRFPVYYKQPSLRPT